VEVRTVASHPLNRLVVDGGRLADRKPLYTIPIAYAAWFFAFRVPVLDFWTRITIAAFVLLAVAVALGRKELDLRPKPLGIAVGLVAAVALYLFFWSGYQVMKGVPGFTGTISSVYSLGTGEPSSTIALVLLFPIGPTEEIYWRGFIQKYFGKSMSTRSSILLTSTVYGFLHLSTLNPSLILVAFIGGLVWGYLYVRFGLPAAMASHILWDEMIFVFFVIS
jgi:uncharacterized protein